MDNSIPVCGLCSITIREGIRVPHYGSTGQYTHTATFCTDCWAAWQNVRENLDGSNEFGIQGMTCPDCSRTLCPSHDMEYVKTPARLYTITLKCAGRPDRQCLVSINTRTIDFKRSILWDPTISIDDVDLTLEDDHDILERIYLCAPQDAVIRAVIRTDSDSQFITIVRFTDKRTYMLEVEPMTTIHEIKHMINEYTGIPSSNQRLVLRCRHLDDNDLRVLDMDIQVDDVIHLIPSIRGDIGEFDSA